MSTPDFSPLQTEYPFTLSRGYLDTNGNLHQEGVMRLARGIDEVGPRRDPRVKDNPDYLTFIVLARVITRLGTLVEVNPATIENLFVSDLDYLQDFYRRINSEGENHLTVTCPKCQHVFPVEVVQGGEW